MSLLGRSLLDINDLSETEVFALFKSAQRLRHLHQTNKLDAAQLMQVNASKYVAMMFFESSTRTRSSFEVACYKLGLKVLAPEFGPGSSRSKGESLVDTFLNVSAMDPDAIILRSSGSPELLEVCHQSEIPVINAGSGQIAHPSQALLDAFTIYEELGSVKGRKVLLVGDIKHGRVARSNIQLLSLLGAEVAICAPKEFLPESTEGLIVFDQVDEGIDWADVVMGLRIQLERHREEPGGSSGVVPQAVLSKEDYASQYGISAKRMNKLGAGILMHPGPVNQGVELLPEVLHDPRSRILKQVKNGVYIRSAVLSQVLGIRV